MPDIAENPFSTELSEQRLLGSLMGRPANWEATHGILAPEDFFNPVHGRIFESLSIVYGEGEVPTAASLVPYFAHDPDLAHLPGSGVAYIADLERQAISTFALPETAKTIKRMAVRRRFLEALEGAKVKASDTAEPLIPVIAELKSTIDKATDAEIVASSFDKVVSRIAARMSQNAQPMSTGIRCLDDAMDGGLVPGYTYGFAAAAKVGKTTLALSISHNLNMAGTKHAYIAYEMGMEEIVQRQISRHMRWSPSRFRGVGMKDRAAEIERQGMAMPRNVLFLDRAHTGFDILQTEMARLVLRSGIKGIIIDYWQLVSGVQKGQTKEEHLSNVAQFIAGFCRRHGIWSIVLSQLNKEDNAFGSAGLNRACDQFYKLYRSDINNCRDQGWLDLEHSRYTVAGEIGSEESPTLRHHTWCGPYFSDFSELVIDPETGEVAA